MKLTIVLSRSQAEIQLENLSLLLCFQSAKMCYADCRVEKVPLSLSSTNYNGNLQIQDAPTVLVVSEQCMELMIAL